MKSAESTCLIFLKSLQLMHVDGLYIGKACVSLHCRLLDPIYLSFIRSVSQITVTRPLAKAAALCKRRPFPALALPCLLSRLFQQHLHWRESEVACHAHSRPATACMTRMNESMNGKRTSATTYHHAPKPDACWCGRQEVNVRALCSNPSIINF